MTDTYYLKRLRQLHSVIFRRWQEHLARDPDHDETPCPRCRWLYGVLTGLEAAIHIVRFDWGGVGESRSARF